MNVLVVFMASLLGGMVQTVAGFGCGIVIMLLLPYYLPIVQATGLSITVCAILNVMLVVKYRRSVNFKLVLAPACISFLMSTVCVYYSSHMELQSLKLVFGVFLIALAVYFIFFSEKIKLKANVPTVVTCASLAGAANGLFGIGGPPMALYFLTVTKGKEEYIGTTQMYFLLTSLYVTIVRIIGGILDKRQLLLAVPGIAAVLIGECIGGLIVGKISQQKMKHIIYVALIVSGLITFVQCP